MPLALGPALGDGEARTDCLAGTDLVREQGTLREGRRQREERDVHLVRTCAVASDNERSWDGSDKITIDLTRFEGVDDDEARVLHRYVNTIQVQRQDFNGRMLTIRRDDLRAIAAAAGIDVDALVHRLDDLQLRRA